MKHLLVVVDMQYDFINGALFNAKAQEIVEPMRNYLENEFDGDVIIFTQDSHKEETYMKSQEGKHLPIPHCIMYTDGWLVERSLWQAACNNKKVKNVELLNKPTFGYAQGLMELIQSYGEIPEKITLIGTCTDICVVSNALGLKEKFPEVPIKVIANLCAGLTEEKHEAALEVMRSCQVEVE